MTEIKAIVKAKKWDNHNYKYRIKNIVNSPEKPHIYTHKHTCTHKNNHGKMHRYEEWQNKINKYLIH